MIRFMPGSLEDDQVNMGRDLKMFRFIPGSLEEDQVNVGELWR